MTFPRHSLDLEKELTKLNLILETLKKLDELVERTLELNEEEVKKQIIREFRIKLIDKLLSRLREINHREIH